MLYEVFISNLNIQILNPCTYLDIFAAIIIFQLNFKQLFFVLIVIVKICLSMNNYFVFHCSAVAISYQSKIF